MLPLTIWMNMPSFYQGDLFRSLVATGEVDLQAVFARALPPDRLRTGWKDDLSGYSYRFLNGDHPFKDALRIARSQRNRIHIFNGLWAEKPFALALVRLALAGSQYAVYSEFPDHWKWQPPTPTLYDRLTRIIREWIKAPFGRVFAPRAVGILPVSRLAADFYRGLGVREEAIYPFGYFRSSPGLAIAANSAKGNGRIEIVYVGRLVPLKRIDLLLEAMLPLFREHPNLIFVIVGDGELLEPLRQQVEALALVEQVRFEGVIASDQIPTRLAVADLLVLPSHGEGWGLVINEALSVGVPVVASDHCGAADLIRHGDNGYIFRSGDAEDLRACLRTFLERRSDWPRMRANAALMGERISTDVAAAYLVHCLQHMIGGDRERPVPPWLAEAQKAPVKSP